MTADRIESALRGFAARTSVAWQRTGVFLIRGRARLEGGNLLADGRFAVWGDPSRSLLRCDFCGPDGRPVVSAAGDSTGVTVYYPRDEEAFFCPGGLPVAGGVVPVRSVLFLIRSGLPLEMEHWAIVASAERLAGGAAWLFSCGADTVVASLGSGEPFPELVWPGGGLQPHGMTPGDEYDAWPSSWDFTSGGTSVHAEVTSAENGAVPWPGLWEMTVPVRIETLQTAAPLALASPPDTE